MLKVKKEIKTNYKVAVLANKIEKMLNEKLKHYISSKYHVWQHKLYDGDRYVYVTCEDGVGNITSLAMETIIKNVNPIADEHLLGSVCQGVTIIEREIDGTKINQLAYYILICKMEH